jgi:hypothetical protein
MPTKIQSVSRPRQRAMPNPVESPPNKSTSTNQHDEQFQAVHARISERAYALYEERGREDGHALENWLEAEQQVRNQGL